MMKGDRFFWANRYCAKIMLVGADDIESQLKLLAGFSEDPDTDLLAELRDCNPSILDRLSFLEKLIQQAQFNTSFALDGILALQSIRQLLQEAIDAGSVRIRLVGECVQQLKDLRNSAGSLLAAETSAARSQAEVPNNFRERNAVNGALMDADRILIRFDISKSSLSRLAQKGDLTRIKAGRKYVYDYDQIAAIADATDVKSNEK